MMKAPLGDEKRVDLVFEGSGVKGIALAGALAVLEEKKFELKYRAGTSSGAIVAALSAAGYTGIEIHKIIMDQDFDLFKDKGWKKYFPDIISGAIGILKKQGMYKGDYFLGQMEKLLADKNVHTFRDLIIPEYIDEPKYKYRLKVIASDITERRVLILPDDAVHFGIEPDDLSVAQAVRMSMSFPLFFEPVRQLNPKTDRIHLIVDGGLVSDFPVWIFDSGDNPEWPTFGIKLIEDENEISVEKRLSLLGCVLAFVGPVVPFIRNMVFTVFEAHDRLYIENHNSVRTIPISSLGVDTLNFALPPETSQDLYDSGKNATNDFLMTWDFDQYKDKYRNGKTFSRQ